MTIGATLDLRSLARLHAPKTTDEIHAAIHELHSRGFSDGDIALACDISVEYVRRVKSEPAKQVNPIDVTTTRERNVTTTREIRGDMRRGSGVRKP